MLAELGGWEFLGFLALGFVAQLIDGALGMAYGLVATTTLLSVGLAPANASAATHAAEIVTTGLAGGSHIWNKNVDWKLFLKLMPMGVAGGVVGAYILTNLPENAVKAFITIYLLAMTVIIIRRIQEKKTKVGTKAQREKKLPTIPVGLAGGFLDAIGGGGWGPVVTSTLLARGDHPRQTIGTVSLSEFFLTTSVSVAFILTLDLAQYWKVVLGLIVGGACAAPLAGYLSRVLKPKILMIMVACAIGLLSIYNLIKVSLEAWMAWSGG
jgi:uncharacterized membrane protein YfcA